MTTLERDLLLDEAVKAMAAVERAYRNYGPVDDGRPEGRRFEKALDALDGTARAIRKFRRRGGIADRKKPRRPT